MTAWVLAAVLLFPAAAFAAGEDPSVPLLLYLVVILPPLPHVLLEAVPHERHGEENAEDRQQDDPEPGQRNCGRRIRSTRKSSHVDEVLFSNALRRRNATVSKTRTARIPPAMIPRQTRYSEIRLW